MQRAPGGERDVDSDIELALVEGDSEREDLDESEAEEEQIWDCVAIVQDYSIEMKSRELRKCDIMEEMVGVVTEFIALHSNEIHAAYNPNRK